MAGENKLESPGGFDLANNLASNLNVFSIKPIAKYLSGARCTLKVGGRIVGFAFSVSWTIETKVTEILTIDNYEPHELAPSRVDVHGSISGFRIPGSSPGQLHMQPDVLNFLHQPYIEIEVRDSQTDEIIFMTKRAMITNRQEVVKTNSLAELTLQFKAIGFRDELTPEPPATRG
jgi:hypothetical protein